MNRLTLSILFIATLLTCSHAQKANLNIRELVNQIKEGYTFNEHSWLISLEGDTVPFTSLKGEWIILDYWSAGCRPCIEAFPYLALLNKQDTINIKVVGINVDQSFSRFKKYHKKYKIAYTDYFSGFTLENTLMLANLHLVKSGDGDTKLITRTPQYLLVNPEGTIIIKDMSKPGTDSFLEELKIINQ